ncbi:MAG: energy transducer TonB [Muribaculaceae bacterium]|nr:energy transducer TonB [Muribaculaceae bacterium]
MRIASLIFATFLLASQSIVAQSDDFDSYSHELRKADVTLTAPKSFKSIDLKGRRNITYNINPNWSDAIPVPLIAGAVLDNDDEGVAFIYPQVLFDNKSTKNAHVIETELRQNNDDMELDIRPIINIIAGEDMSEYANADTAVIYEYQFKVPYLDTYRTCVGVYLRKYGHPALLMKIALSNKAADKKDKYLRLLLDNVAYGDNPEESMLAAEKNSNGTDLQFPTKYRYFTGILPDVDDETLDEVNRVDKWCKEHGVKKLPYFDDETLKALNEFREFSEAKNTSQSAPMKLMQTEPKETDSYATLDKSVYNMATVERQPFYYGGMEAMQKWIAEHIQYPAEAIETQTEGKVIVEFIVDENGNVTDPQILKGLTIELNNEAKRVVKEMPDWRPGKVKGETVKTYYTIPITFRLPGK